MADPPPRTPANGLGPSEMRRPGITRWRWAGAVFAFAAVAAGCSLESRVEEPPGEDPAALTADSVRAAFEAYRRAVNALDLETAGDFYSRDPDFHWMEDGRVAYESGEAAAAGLQSLANFPTMRFETTEPRVTVLAPGLVLLSTTFEQGIEATDGTEISFRGAVSAVMRHEADGWKFLAGHTSTLVPRGDADGG